MNTPVDPVRLRADDVSIGYGGAAVSTGLSVDIPDGQFTVIVGPNACGKSTLLKALARLLAPSAGQIVLDGADIRSYSAKQVARRLGLLPQTSLAPDGIRVVDLVGRGRYPRQSMFRQWSADDAAVVLAAMEATGVADLAARPVDALSGGQRQRVWVAMVLAQETPLILLDEPTTYLDIAHQVELLDLCADLQRSHGRTVVAVLHDLNQAFRYADHLIAMRAGTVVAQGSPREVVTAELIDEVFGLRCRIIADPESGTPMVVPVVTGPRSSG
ncbi:ABC transporter ATP-binding protein [Gordonia shandongensis]|uniref:ABC transporter ATP-binding protein n=1 Tax=Gordonia shandongensis TaxID=376351 RepID=UPI00047D3CD4|nr:ABC transporter ATP-binding protein [Gordonia shandongensis]